MYYVSLNARTSDHSPLVLRGDNPGQSISMFWFDNYLTLSAEFIPSVQRIWQQHIVGTAMFAVTRKLRALKPVFRAQRQKRGDLSNNVKLAEGFLEAAQLLLEQHMLHQRAKITWMKGGDQCSCIFFRKVAKRHSSKRVFQITDSDGQVLTSQPAVTNEFITFYQTLLGGSQRDRLIDLRYLRPWARHILSEEEARSLLLPVTTDEIKQAVFDIDETKAPGPDDYSSGFFKAAWPIVGREVTRAIMDFFITGRLLKQVNSTLISLIPKVNKPMVVAEFRPVSCCNVLYKVITKILVQRMRGILDKLISPSQNAFVPGRSIGDNILLAQELFYGYNQQHLPPRCALKVDLRKAYDTVEWDFLRAVLILFGFPEQFILWIIECVTTPSFSVCLNGSPHGYFRGARGLRQGDPMSPYLFVLVMEVLTLLLRQIIDQDGGFSYHWKCGEMQLCQLGFADDLLLFSKADMSLVHIFKRALTVFADLSGLRANLHKSHLILSRSAGPLRDTLLAILDFQEGHLPLRVQLIKSVMSALQVYWAMAFILPKHVIKEIEQRLRNFLWKGSTDVGYAKVSWQQVCRPVSEGGLGTRDLHALNRGLMSRHLWRSLQLTAPPFGWIGFSIIGFGISLFGRSVIDLDHGGGENWFDCGKGFIRLFFIRLGEADFRYLWEPLRFLGIDLFYGWIFLDDCPPWINPGCNIWALLVCYARMLYQKLMSTCSLHAPLRLNVCMRYWARFPFTGLTLLGQWSFSGPWLDGGESTLSTLHSKRYWLHWLIIYGKNGIDVYSSTLRDRLLILLGLLFLRLGI
ncbi:UNVERIFIED_CONTAM: LINE-1 reverse transcriptase [Sesamum latifolium]|uniref:LINE-1 reverse transcriptase n=1 Tax=Sesamum latifolium TaxID=2727402 RepID=A0AAW2TB22_9LAMI